MKTIELTSGNQKALFTTKSVTFDNKEFLYSHMSDVKNDIENSCYIFTYDGVRKLLPYETKDAKVLEVIFGQVIKMEEKRKAALAYTMSVKVSPEFHEQVAAAEAEAAAGKQETPAKDAEAAEEQQEIPAETGKPSAETEQKTSSEETQEEVPAEEPVTEAKGTEAEETPVEKPAEEQPAEAETSGETAEKEEFLTYNEQKKRAKAQKKLEKHNAKKAENPEDKPADPEKKAKLKKSLTVFGIVIGAVLIISLIYFAIFGTANDPSSAAPNSTEQQQYEDIDQLIEDLQ